MSVLFSLSDFVLQLNAEVSYICGAPGRGRIGSRHARGWSTLGALSELRTGLDTFYPDPPARRCVPAHLPAAEDMNMERVLHSGRCSLKKLKASPAETLRRPARVGSAARIPIQTTRGQKPNQEGLWRGACPGKVALSGAPTPVPRKDTDSGQPQNALAAAWGAHTSFPHFDALTALG